MIRQISGLIIGYLIFVVGSLAFFKFSGIDPHATASSLMVILTALYGATFSLISGFVTQFVAKTKNLITNYTLAVIMAAFASFSYFKASGSHWTQILAVFIFAPISIAGGWLYLKQKNKTDLG